MTAKNVAPRCDCPIDMDARSAVGDVHQCPNTDICGQLWKAVPAERATCMWVRVERKAGEVVNLADRRKGGRANG